MPASARVVVRGAVQGVGFRPFVYRLATEQQLTGSVRNTPEGIEIRVHGDRPPITAFVARLRTEKPPFAILREVEITWEEESPMPASFVIEESTSGAAPTALILPDLATCRDCLREILDPFDRRHRYPFTNCTHCGPRFSLIEALPYDRSRTTMRAFRMCARCEAEYHDPTNRRFHAQPTACPECGPRLSLWDPEGKSLGKDDAALRQAASAVRAGQIVALKGIGGFQLLVDATDPLAVGRLRERKGRPDKPFAVLFSDVTAAAAHCELSAAERRLLESASAPIVLTRRRAGTELCAAVAPNNPWVGALLPYSPLHHLLAAEIGRPAVATSGNRTDEPICTDENEALARLHDIADLFLVHDRPIARPLDDSVVKVVVGQEQVLRRARGYSPLPIRLGAPVPPTVAAGAHLKNCVALARGLDAFLGPHIGDLSHPAALAAFDRSLKDLPRLYAIEPQIAACDAHPDYPSTRKISESFAHPVVVQHHHAHVLACMTEHGLEGPVLGVSWDGAGLGADGTVWGGEFLRVCGGSFTRAAHLRPFPLPGGEAAAREPRRSALGIAYAAAGEMLFDRADDPALRPFQPMERTLLRGALARGVNCPLTSSMGRLFDAVAALAGLRSVATFEGQAAMELEHAIDASETLAYPLGLHGSDPAILDWEPLMAAVRHDLTQGLSAGRISARFHQGLVDAIVAVAQKVGIREVVLTGGVFQNSWLLERAVGRLTAAHFTAYWPQRIPPNDGGIALGQVAAVSALSG